MYENGTYVHALSACICTLDKDVRRQTSCMRTYLSLRDQSYFPHAYVPMTETHINIRLAYMNVRPSRARDVCQHILVKGTYACRRYVNICPVLTYVHASA